MATDTLKMQVHSNADKLAIVSYSYLALVLAMQALVKYP